MEIIPVTLGENAGLDPIDITSDLRVQHEKGQTWAGVDVFKGKVKDMRKLEVYEPLVVKKQTIKSAAEAATMILKIDDIIAAGKMKTPPMPPGVRAVQVECHQADTEACPQNIKPHIKLPFIYYLCKYFPIVKSK